MNKLKLLLGKRATASPDPAANQRRVEQIRRRARQKVEAVDELLSQLPLAIDSIGPDKPGVGHNSIVADDDRAPWELLAQIRAEILELRSGASLIDAPATEVAKRGEILATFSRGIGNWLGERGNKFADAAAGSAGKAVGAALFIQLAQLGPALTEAAAALHRLALALN